MMIMKENAEKMWEMLDFALHIDFSHKEGYFPLLRVIFPYSPKAHFSENDKVRFCIKDTLYSTILFQGYFRASQYMEQKGVICYYFRECSPKDT
jgi:hypothetical protein